MLDHSYWQKQGGEPLCPELEWNKPERRDQAGRLLIVGGNLHALSSPAKSYELALKTGIGGAKIALPDKTKRLVGATLPDTVFLPSTSSGEFSKDGLDQLLGYALWADTLLLPGDSGRNSQTAILFEQLLKSYSGQMILTRDAIDILLNTPEVMLDRVQTTLVVSFAQLQKLISGSGSQTPLTFTMDLVKLVEFLHTFTTLHPCAIVTLHQNQFVVATKGMVSTTKIKNNDPDNPTPWRNHFATKAACFQTWNPEKTFESLTHTAFIVT